MFCTNCGAEIDDKAVVCVKCGVAVRPAVVPAVGGGEWLTALLLCFFFGWLGVHRF